MARSLGSQYLTFALGIGALLCALIGALLLYDHRVDSREFNATTFGTVQQKLETDLRHRAQEISNQAAPQLAASLGASNQTELRLIATRLLDDRDVLRVEIRSPSNELLYSKQSERAPPSSLPPLRAETPLTYMAPHVGELQNASLQVWMSRGSMESVLRNLGSQMEGQQADRLRQRLSVFAGVIIPLLTLAAMGAWLIARSLSRPISALVRTANSIGEGDLSRPLDVKRRDELGQLQDAIERMRQNLRETTITKNYLTTVLNSLGDAVLVTSPDGIVRSSNQAAQQLLGHMEEEIVGKPLLSFIDEPHRAAFDLNQVAGENRETVIRTAAGQTIPVSMAGAPITTEDPQFLGHIYVARNITERKRAERRIRYLARYDTLTKMPNRMQFQHLLQQAIARARRNQRLVALLYLDLDRFKEVNDTFGHAAGDRTLEILSERLTRNLSKEMVIGRLAGDEFAMFIDGLPAERMLSLQRAERLTVLRVAHIGVLSLMGARQAAGQRVRASSHGLSLERLLAEEGRQLLRHDTVEVLLNAEDVQERHAARRGGDFERAAKCGRLWAAGSLIAEGGAIAGPVELERTGEVGNLVLALLHPEGVALAADGHLFAGGPLGDALTLSVTDGELSVARHDQGRSIDAAIRAANQHARKDRLVKERLGVGRRG